MMATRTDAVEQDMVAGDSAGLIEQLSRPQGWSIPLSLIVAQDATRLDAEHYEPSNLENLNALYASGYELVPLRELAELRLPGLFTRVWAKDADHGVQYINATDFMSLAATGLPAQTRFVSHFTKVNMDNLRLRTGWILVTCSGTLGRVHQVSPGQNDWVATHEIIRIIPHDQTLRGYIRAFLCSDFAQVQILKHTHGGQIDHITDDQIGACMVPMLPAAKMRALSTAMDSAEKARDDAATKVANALITIRQELTIMKQLGHGL